MVRVRAYSKCLILAVVGVLTGLCLVGQQATAQDGYVTLRGNSTLGAFNTTDNTIFQSLGGFSDPTQMVISPDGSTAYVSDVDAALTRVVDLTTLTVTDSLNLGSGLFGRALNPDGSKLYLSVFGEDEIVVIDTSTNEKIQTVSVAGPFSLALSPDGETIYVSVNAGQVQSYDAATGNLIDSVPVSSPRDIVVSPDGSKLYVLDTGLSPSVNVINAEGLDLIESIDGTHTPNQLALTPDASKLYVSELVNDEVSVIDTTTNTEVDTVSALKDPKGVALTASGSELYVASNGDDETVEIDTSNSTISQRFATLTSPEDIAFKPDQAPVASFTVSVASAGSATTFDGSASSDTDGTVAQYDWDFGDGTTLNDGGATPSHIYATAGNYEVALTVTDSNGTSKARLYTGQMLLRNGGESAKATQSIIVKAAPVDDTGGTGGGSSDPVQPPSGSETSKALLAVTAATKTKALKSRKGPYVFAFPRADLSAQFKGSIVVRKKIKDGNKVKLKTIKYIKLPKVKKSLKEGKRKLIRFTTHRSKRIAIRRELRRGRALYLKVKATVEKDSDGNSASSQKEIVKKTVRLRR